MAFPRILAMAEVVWSGPTENPEEAYPQFLSRTEHFMERLDVLNINYANHLYDLEGTIEKNDAGVFFKLTTPTQGKEIRYTINSAVEQTYNAAFKITEDSRIHAQVYKNGKREGRPFSETIRYHKGLDAIVSINAAPHPAYGTGGTKALINGISGSDTRYGDKEWLGFWGDDLEITITFNEPTEISEISTRFYNANGQWIYAPNEIEVETEIDTETFNITNKENTLLQVHATIPGTTNFVKIKIPSYGTIPEGLQGAGNKAWTFIDEIVIE